MPREDTVTIKKAAQILGVTPLTLRNWDKKKKLSAYRHPANFYRLYKISELEEFKKTGFRAKIEEREGYKEAVKCRIEEFEEAKKAVNIIALPGSTTFKAFLVDQKINAALKEAARRGIKVRFIRNLANKEMFKRALIAERFGVETKHYPFQGFNLSIRDNKVVRLEVPTEDKNGRFNLIIRDKNLASAFNEFYNSLWLKAKSLEELGE